MYGLGELMNDSVKLCCGEAEFSCNNSFLEYLVKIFFSSYQDKKIYLSIFNLDKNCIFTTERTKEEFGFLKHVVDSSYHSLSDLEVLKIKYYNGITRDVLDICINKQSIVSCIIFDKLIIHHGALHIIYTPIFAPDGKICGVLSQAYDHTRLFWGCGNFNDNNPEVNLSKLNSLTQRQQDILYLLAIGYSQEKVSSVLGIKRGTLTNVCHNISIRFGFDSYSVEKLIEEIGRYNIMKMLNVPNVDIKSMTMYFVHPKSPDFSNEVVKIIDSQF